jgi:lysyl-tRNA synthetase class 2
MPSRVIHRFAYDPPSRTLEVEFVSGRRYRYLRVPAEVAARFRAAFSKGRFFNAHIRDAFACEELPADEADAWDLVPGCT